MVRTFSICWGIVIVNTASHTLHMHTLIPCYFLADWQGNLSPSPVRAASLNLNPSPPNNSLIGPTSRFTILNMTKRGRRAYNGATSDQYIGVINQSLTRALHSILSLAHCHSKRHSHRPSIHRWQDYHVTPLHMLLISSHLLCAAHPFFPRVQNIATLSVPLYSTPFPFQPCHECRYHRTFQVIFFQQVTYHTILLNTTQSHCWYKLVSDKLIRIMCGDTTSIHIYEFLRTQFKAPHTMYS